LIEHFKKKNDENDPSDKGSLSLLGFFSPGNYEFTLVKVNYSYQNAVGGGGSEFHSDKYHFLTNYKNMRNLSCWHLCSCLC